MTTTEHKFRCGDTARCEGETFDIEVAYADYQSGYASWCGWPEGMVEIEKMTLVKACTDEEHRAAVAQWLDSPRGSDPEHTRDHRRERIQRLYRPRAYWREVVAMVTARIEQERIGLGKANESYNEAMAQPGEDA